MWTVRRRYVSLQSRAAQHATAAYSHRFSARVARSSRFQYRRHVGSAQVSVPRATVRLPSYEAEYAMVAAHSHLQYTDQFSNRPETRFTPVRQDRALGPVLHFRREASVDDWISAEDYGEARRDELLREVLKVYALPSDPGNVRWLREQLDGSIKSYEEKSGLTVPKRLRARMMGSLIRILYDRLRSNQ